MASRAKLLALVGFVLLAPTLLVAQDQLVELGFDGGLRISFDDVTETAIAVPFQSIRAGFLVSDNVSLEPALSFYYLKVEDSDALATLGLSVAGLYSFSPDRSKPQPFFRPQAGLTFVSIGGESASQFNVGSGLGVRIPVANQLAVRLEARFQYSFDNADFDSASTITAAVGLSFFTR